MSSEYKEQRTAKRTIIEGNRREGGESQLFKKLQMKQSVGSNQKDDKTELFRLVL